MAVDLIINPTARGHQRTPQAVERMRALARGRCRVHVTPTLEQLDEVATVIASRGSELVMLSGGDGTLMAGVSALARHCGAMALPPIAPLPGGTAGTVARNWGMAGSPVVRLRRMLAGGRRLVARPSLLIRSVTATGAEERRVGFIVGTGLVAQFFDLYYQRGAPGYLGAARIVSRVFVESFWGGSFARRVLQPLGCTLEVEGQRLAPPAWSLICAAVVRDLGIHMLVNHRAGEDPSRPHLVATPLPPAKLAPRAPRVLRGVPMGGPHDVDELVADFTIGFERVGPVVIDGELLEVRRAHVAAGPTLKVACPA